jgi:rhodanese-related sulfurtransferase
MSRHAPKTLIFLFIFAFYTASWAGDAYWVDVRTAEEYEKDHVSQAVNIPYEELATRITEVTADKDAVIYLYCRSGRRADIAKEALEARGYSQVINLETLENARKKAAEPASS